MKYRVMWEQGNGYHCPCCRQVWTSFDTFDDEGKALRFVARLRAQIAKYSDYDERADIRGIELIRFDEVTSPNQDMIDEEMAKLED